MWRWQTLLFLPFASLVCLIAAPGYTSPPNMPGVVRKTGGRGADSAVQLEVPPCTGNFEVRLEVSPHNPIVGEPITLHISGTSWDSCVPAELGYELLDSRIDVYAREPSCSGAICAMVLTSWAFDVSLDPLPPGVYEVSLYFRCRWLWLSPSEACSQMSFTVAPCYDLDTSGQIDVEDVQAVAGRWHQRAGLPYDCDGDGQITVWDIMCVAARLERTCPQAFAGMEGDHDGSTNSPTFRNIRNGFRSRGENTPQD